MNTLERVDLDDVEPVQSIPHSLWQRQLPDWLRYTRMGNPFASVVQTLFHSLTNANGEAFTIPAPNTARPSRVSPMWFSLHRSCMVFRGEGANQVIKLSFLLNVVVSSHMHQSNYVVTCVKVANGCQCFL